MTRGADQLPVSDHVVLRYLQRVLGVDVDAVRRLIHAQTQGAVDHDARAVKTGGIVYKLRDGYVTTCFVGEPQAVRRQHAEAAKKILRRSRNVPILPEE